MVKRILHWNRNTQMVTLFTQLLENHTQLTVQKEMQMKRARIEWHRRHAMSTLEDCLWQTAGRFANKVSHLSTVNTHGPQELNARRFKI